MRVKHKGPRCEILSTGRVLLLLLLGGHYSALCLDLFSTGLKKTRWPTTSPHNGFLPKYWCSPLLLIPNSKSLTSVASWWYVRVFNFTPLKYTSLIKNLCANFWNETCGEFFLMNCYAYFFFAYRYGKNEFTGSRLIFL